MRNLFTATVIGLVSTTAFAQEAEVAADVEVVQQEQAAEENRPADRSLDEIVVTAQKRSEALIDVPLSVSVVSGETLREKNIDNFNDLALYTPNVKISAGSVAGFVKIRGLGSGNNKGFEQAVGYIVDGVYYGRLNYLGGAMLDMERVEVLRGPQGTLMGKNTIAGAINIATGRPQNEWGADLSYAMGDYDKRTITGMVTGPIIEDVLSFRVAAKSARRDGFMYNATQDRDEINNHTDDVRVKLAYDGIENLSVVGTYEFRDFSQRVWGFQVNKATPQMTALYRTFDPRFNDNDQDRVGYFDQNGDALREIQIGVLQVDYELGDFNLSSVSGWSGMEQSNLIDADFGPAPILTLGSEEEWMQWSQEFRLVSPVGELDYVAGLYFFGSELTNDSDLRLLPDVDPLDTVGGVLIPDALQPIADQIPSLTGPLSGDRSEIHFNQESFSVALYGQANWHITEDLTLTVGARVSYEEKEATSQQEFENNGLFFMQFLGQEEYVTSGSREEIDFSPKLSVKYEFTDGLTAYATVAQAYKGGGFNTAAARADEFEFDEETAMTYEAGAKSKFLGGLIRANFAVFWTEFDNMQVSVFDGTKFVVRNAASATTRGAEFDGTAVLGRGLFVNASVGYTYARYDSFPGGPCPAASSEDSCDLSGKELDRAPEWNGTIGVNYMRQIGSLPIQFMIGADANYQGDQHMATDLDMNEFQPAFWLYNGRVGLKDIDGVWSFVVNGSNLTDDIILAGGGDVPAMNNSHMGAYFQPRFISAEFRFQF